PSLPRPWGGGWGPAVGAGPSRRLLLGPAVGLFAAVGERGQARADLALALQVRLREGVAPRVAGPGEHEPPWVDDHRTPAGVLVGRVGSELVGGDHEHLVLD